MKEKYLTRQLDIIPLAALSEEITIIGAGAIGSFTALSLAKMGFCNISVWDFDTVSDENMSCQFYRIKDIGKAKVDALHDLVKDFTDTSIKPVNRRYEGGAFGGIVISAVDNMAVRDLLWTNIKNFGYNNRRFIDARMASEYALLYVVTPQDKIDQDMYGKTLYTDEEAIQERCTAKATMYTVNMIAGLVAKSVKDIVTDGNCPYEVQWAISNNHFQNYPKGEANV